MVADIRDELRWFYYAEPFKPFEIIIDDGRKAQVTKPYYVGWSDREVIWASGSDDFDTALSKVKEIRVAPMRRRRTTKQTRRRKPKA